jgi:Flp pilus assembly pilin Flp
LKKMTLSEWRDLVRAMPRREPGQTMVEYGVVLAVITMGAVATFTALSVGVSGIVSRVASIIPR